MAPMNADSRIAIKPLIEKAAVVTLPPINNMTKATPNPAPLLIPKMPGPAKGLRKAVCNNRPHTAKEAPDRSAVKACGSRESIIMKCHEG